MRKYITADEYDSLYDRLPEEVGFVMYGDTLPDAIRVLQKDFAVYVDKLAPINTLIIDTLLGLCPATEFKNELLIIGLDPKKAEEVTAYIDEHIFSQIQDYLVDQYAEKTEEVDLSYEEQELDPYRESVPIIPGRGPIIESEHLEPSKEHILDEMFASHAPKIKELTPEDGAIIKPLDETPQHTDLFKDEAPDVSPETAAAPEPSAAQSSFREKMLSRRKTKEEESFVGKDEFTAAVSSSDEKPEIDTKLSVAQQKITLSVSKQTTQERDMQKPSKISILIAKKKDSIPDAKEAENKNPTNTPEYSLDPYRENL